MARVFVSHADDGGDQAREIRQWLVEDGHEVFLDLDRQNGIAAGEQWRARLHERLRWADAVVCVVSTASVQSRWCAAEVEVARSRGSRLLRRSQAGGAAWDRQTLDSRARARHSDVMDQTDLATFLRRRREALQPDDVGMPPGLRRRTPGLRREEVAVLCGMSTDYYSRLERGRGPQPSEQMLTAIARGLRLTLDERDHLFVLAGHNAPARAAHSDHVNAGMMRILDRLEDTPAQVVTGTGETIIQTRLAVALFGDQTHFTGLRRSIIYRWFTDPNERTPTYQTTTRRTAGSTPPTSGQSLHAKATVRAQSRSHNSSEPRAPSSPHCGPRTRSASRTPAARESPTHRAGRSPCIARSSSIPTSPSHCWCSPPPPARKTTTNSSCSRSSEVSS